MPHGNILQLSTTYIISWSNILLILISKLLLAKERVPTGKKGAKDKSPTKRKGSPSPKRKSPAKSPKRSGPPSRQSSAKSTTQVMPRVPLR